jgi:glycosyltransferase involved in cell wall biosynthesis
MNSMSVREQQGIIDYVELGHTGHRPVWVRHTAEAFLKRASGYQLNIWVTQEFTEVHAAVCKRFAGTRVHFRVIDKEVSGGPQLFRSTDGRLELISKCVRLDDALVCFVANQLDSIARYLALSRPWLLHRTKLVGVMDVPFLHYRTFHSSANHKYTSFRRYTKAYVLNFLLAHRSCVAEVLMLDPLAPEFYRKVLWSSKFHFLHESFHAQNCNTDSLRERLGLPADRCILAFLGATDPRKGIFELLGAFERLLTTHPEFRSEVVLLIAGTVTPETATEVYGSIARIRSLAGLESVCVINRLLTDEEFASFTVASDIVATPYTDFVGTSGVMMNAAAAGRPVLTTETGVVGELTRRYQLGYCCDTKNPEALTSALAASIAGARSITPAACARLKAFAQRYAVCMESFGAEICSSLIRVADSVRR